MGSYMASTGSLLTRATKSPSTDSSRAVSCAVPGAISDLLLCGACLLDMSLAAAGELQVGISAHAQASAFRKRWQYLYRNEGSLSVVGCSTSYVLIALPARRTMPSMPIRSSRCGLSSAWDVKSMSVQYKSVTSSELFPDPTSAAQCEISLLIVYALNTGAVAHSSLRCMTKNLIGNRVGTLA